MLEFQIGIRSTRSVLQVDLGIQCAINVYSNPEYAHSVITGTWKRDHAQCVENGN